MYQFEEAATSGFLKKLATKKIQQSAG